jgi:hypothetical protein
MRAVVHRARPGRVFPVGHIQTAPIYADAFKPVILPNPLGRNNASAARISARIATKFLMKKS